MHAANLTQAYFFTVGMDVDFYNVQQVSLLTKIHATVLNLAINFDMNKTLFLVTIWYFFTDITEF